MLEDAVQVGGRAAKTVPAGLPHQRLMRGARPTSAAQQLPPALCPLPCRSLPPAGEPGHGHGLHPHHHGAGVGSGAPGAHAACWASQQASQGGRGLLLLHRGSFAGAAGAALSRQPPGALLPAPANCPLYLCLGAGQILHAGGALGGPRGGGAAAAGRGGGAAGGDAGARPRRHARGVCRGAARPWRWLLGCLGSGLALVTWRNCPHWRQHM